MAPSRRIAIAALAVGLVVSGGVAGGGLLVRGDDEDQVVRAGSLDDVEVTTAPTTPPTTSPRTTIGTSSARIEDALPAPSPAPVRLRIEAIGVDAPVVGVGLAAGDELEVPAASDVGWYRFGPSPGDPGSAVLAAHVDYDGERGVFFDLRSLEPGARLVVITDDGRDRTYEVEALRQYPKEGLPADEVFGREGDPRLALITCGGAFDPSARSYRDNVIAYALPVA